VGERTARRGRSAGPVRTVAGPPAARLPGPLTTRSPALPVARRSSRMTGGHYD